jgi:hypothetical protein
MLAGSIIKDFNVSRPAAFIAAPVAYRRLGYRSFIKRLIPISVEALSQQFPLPSLRVQVPGLHAGLTVDALTFLCREAAAYNRVAIDGAIHYSIQICRCAP